MRRILAVAVAVLSLAACNARAQAVDTRPLSSFGFDTAAVVELAQVGYARAPIESGFCLYGDVERDGAHLSIKQAKLAAIHHADSVNVVYICDQNVPRFVGVAHTHTMPTALCIPSDLDFVPLIEDNRIMISLIMCLNMTTSAPNAYAQLHDARWAWLRWELPPGVTSQPPQQRS